jgi:hypothetical protein
MINSLETSNVDDLIFTTYMPLEIFVNGIVCKYLSALKTNSLSKL